VIQSLGRVWALSHMHRNTAATGEFTLGLLKPLPEQFGGALGALHVFLGRQRKDISKATYCIPRPVGSWHSTRSAALPASVAVSAALGLRPACLCLSQRFCVVLEPGLCLKPLRKQTKKKSEERSCDARASFRMSEAAMPGEARVGPCYFKLPGTPAMSAAHTKGEKTGSLPDPAPASMSISDFLHATEPAPPKVQGMSISEFLNAADAASTAEAASGRRGACGEPAGRHGVSAHGPGRPPARAGGHADALETLAAVTTAALHAESGALHADAQMKHLRARDASISRSLQPFSEVCDMRHSQGSGAISASSTIGDATATSFCIGTGLHQHPHGYGAAAKSTVVASLQAEKQLVAEQIAFLKVKQRAITESLRWVCGSTDSTLNDKTPELYRSVPGLLGGGRDRGCGHAQAHAHQHSDSGMLTRDSSPGFRRGRKCGIG
jgi:hypothetical protein